MKNIYLFVLVCSIGLSGCVNETAGRFFLGMSGMTPQEINQLEAQKKRERQIDEAMQVERERQDLERRRLEMTENLIPLVEVCEGLYRSKAKTEHEAFAKSTYDYCVRYQIDDTDACIESYHRAFVFACVEDLKGRML